MSEDQKTWGQKAYEAYCQHQEWKSFSGDPLPAWLDARPDIKIAWEYAAESLLVEWRGMYGNKVWEG
jgi:hypothetical protein